MVMISRMRGDVEVRYVRCVSELNKGNGEFVSRADTSVSQRTPEDMYTRLFTSSIVELGGDADTGPVLGREGEVGLAHGCEESRGLR